MERGVLANAQALYEQGRYLELEPQLALLEQLGNSAAELLADGPHWQALAQAVQNLPWRAPEPEFIWLYRSRLAAALQQPTEACVWLQRGLEQDPDQYGLWRELANLYEQQQNWPQPPVTSGDTTGLSSGPWPTAFAAFLARTSISTGV